MYMMVNEATSDRVVTGGVYREVAPFERLVFTWAHPNGDQMTLPVITITLEPVHEGPRMTFELRGVVGTKGDGSFYDGWQEVRVSLGDYLGQSQFAR